MKKIKIFQSSANQSKIVHRWLRFGAMGCIGAMLVKQYLEYHIKGNIKMIPTNIIEQEQNKSDIKIKPLLHNATPWWKIWSKSEMDPQNVIRLTNSASKKTRNKMISKMVTYRGWDDAQHQTIAQSINFQTQVALARHPQTDMRLFLTPPRLPELAERHQVGELLRQLLHDMPEDDQYKCLQYYSSDALNTSEEYHLKNPQKNRAWCFDHAHEDSLIGHNTHRWVECLCLKALVKHSEIEANATSMVKGGILHLLQYCDQIYKDDLEIQMCILRIIANITAFERLHDKVLTSRWVTLLANSARSNEDDVSMQALRALANLDRDGMTEKFVDGVYQLHPKHRTNEEPVADVVFVHGMLGSSFHTWRQNDIVKENRTDCWPKDWFSEDVPQCRVISLEYDTSLTDWRSVCPYEHEKKTIEYRSSHLLDKVIKAGVGDRPIIWIAHSMGGILVKQMLKHAAEMPQQLGKVINNTKGIVFYGTPHFGTAIASYTSKIKSVMFPSVEVLELIQDSPKLHSINQFVKELVEAGKLKTLSFVETQPTRFGFALNVHIVPPESANPGFGDLVEADCNHFNLCKPNDRSNKIYSKMLDFVQNRMNGKEDDDQQNNREDNNDEDAKNFFDSSFYW